MLRRFSFAFMLVSLLALTASAQTPQAVSQNLSASDGPTIRHITDQLFNAPAGQQALRQFQREKAQRGPVLNKAASSPPDVGDTHIFQVQNIDAGSYDAVTFTLKRVRPRFYLWVANNQLGDNQVRKRDLDSLVIALNERTPAGSVDPQAGVIVNDETVFGSPPNVDGDGRSDVLLTDIKDGYDPVENPGYIAGFVDPNDLVQNGHANYRDILYLDAFPGIYTGSGDNVDYQGSRSVASTAAHEYQHLLHANYDQNESSFVNEGLSEYAEIANGYAPRPSVYLADPDAYNVNLLNWDSSLQAYQRAGLFTHYIAERIGAMATGRITRQDENRIAGYNNVLNEEGENFQQIVFDFHTANFLNDTSVDPRLGYRHPGRQGVHAEPTRVIDGRTTTETASSSISITPGAPYYVAWDRVKDFSLTVNATGSDRSRLRARALLYHDDGTISVQDFDNLTDATKTFSGSFDRVVLVLAHVSPITTNANISYSASWASDQTFTVTTKKYDNGQVSSGSAGYVNFGKGIEMLTRFENPSPNNEAFLGGAKLPIYFINQFAGDTPPQNAPRDFTLIVRDAKADGSPGDSLFALTRDDPRSYTGVPANDRTIKFLEVDLSDYSGQLGDLPHTFYLGYRDAGGDDNNIVLANSLYSEENLTYLKGSSYVRLWDVSFDDGSSLKNTVLPVRAQFLTPEGTPVEPSPAGLPSSITLHDAYPNPFAGETTISYDLPEAARVTVSVYDVLGRKVVVPVRGARRAAGKDHRVAFDGSGLAPGVYFVVLRSGDATRTSKMVHVR